MLNDIFQYLNKFIEKAYNKNIKYLVEHYMGKEISNVNGVCNND